MRDSLKLHVGFCHWSDDVGNLFWVVSARDNDGQRWVGIVPVYDERGEICAHAFSGAPAIRID